MIGCDFPADHFDGDRVRGQAPGTFARTMARHRSRGRFRALYTYLTAYVHPLSRAAVRAAGPEFVTFSAGSNALGPRMCWNECVARYYLAFLLLCDGRGAEADAHLARLGFRFRLSDAVWTGGLTPQARCGGGRSVSGSVKEEGKWCRRTSRRGDRGSEGAPTRPSSAAVVIDSALSPALLTSLSDAFAPDGPFFSNHRYLDVGGEGMKGGDGVVDTGATGGAAAGTTDAGTSTSSGAEGGPSPRFYSYHDDLRSHPNSTIAAAATALLPLLAQHFPQHPQLACPEVLLIVT